MKYIKLFENWLNEADEIKFDPNKPEATPVTAITQGQLFGNGGADFEKNLKSLLARSFDKKETADAPSETVVVRGNFQLSELDGNKKGLRIKNTKEPDRELLVKLSPFNGVETNDTLSKVGGDAKDTSLKVFLVHSKSVDDSKVYWKVEKTDEGISTASASIVIFPSAIENKENLAIDMPCVIITEGKVKYVTLGQICAFASTNFSKEGVAMLDKSDSGKKESLAANVFKGSGGGAGGEKQVGPAV